MSSMMVSRVPYAANVAPPEVIAAPGEAPTASGNGHEAPNGRRRFRKRGDGKGEEKRRPRAGDKLRPGAYLDVLI